MISATDTNTKACKLSALQRSTVWVHFDEILCRIPTPLVLSRGNYCSWYCTFRGAAAPHNHFIDVSIGMNGLLLLGLWPAGAALPVRPVCAAPRTRSRTHTPPRHTPQENLHQRPIPLDQQHAPALQPSCTPPHAHAHARSRTRTLALAHAHACIAVTHAPHAALPRSIFHAAASRDGRRAAADFA